MNTNWNQNENNNISKNKKISQFSRWITMNVQPFFKKINNKRQFTALRDTFGIMLPLVILGGTGTLIATVFFGGSGSGYVSLMGLFCKMFHPHIDWVNNNSDVLTIDSIIKGSEIAINNGYIKWSQVSKITSSVFSGLSSATIGLMSIYTSFLIGYFLGKSKKFVSRSICGVVSLASFFLVCMGNISFYGDSSGLLLAILTSVFSTEFLMWLSSFSPLRIRIYGDVPKLVGTSFSLIIPIAIVFGTILALNFCFVIPSYLTNYFQVTKNNTSNFGLSDFFEYTNNDFILSNKVITKLSIDPDAFLKNLPISQTLNSPSLFFKHILESEKNITPQEFFKNLDTYFSSLNLREKSTAGSYLVHYLKDGSITFADLSFGKNIVNFINVDGIFLFNVNYVSVAIQGLNYGVGSAIYQFIISIFVNFISDDNAGLSIALTYVFFIGMLWFFGIHGSNIMIGIFQPLFLSILTINLNLVNSLGYESAAATGQMGVFTTSFFDAFVWIGGSGATLTLSVSLIMLSKRKELVEVSKISATIGVFQMNEPVIFGIPLILNFRYLVPFVFVPVFNVIIGWLFSPAVFNWVHYSYISTPWTAPFLIAGALTTLDIRAFAPSILIFAFDVLLYVPFVIIDNRLFLLELRNESEEKYINTLNYFKSKRYRFELKTDQKVNTLYRKAEEVMINAKEKNSYFEVVYKTNPRKLFELKEITLSRAQTLRDEYTFKAKVLKAERDQIYLTKEPMWNKKEENRRARELSKMIKIESKKIKNHSGN